MTNHVSNITARRSHNLLGWKAINNNTTKILKIKKKLFLFKLHLLTRDCSNLYLERQIKLNLNNKRKRPKQKNKSSDANKFRYDYSFVDWKPNNVCGIGCVVLRFAVFIYLYNMYSTNNNLDARRGLHPTINKI